jgi:hypothetical protein
MAENARDAEILEGALTSLYRDEILPTYNAVKGRISEITGDQAHPVTKTFVQLAAHVNLTGSPPDKYTLTRRGTESCIELTDRLHTGVFIDPTDPTDTYDPEMWKEFERYLNDLQMNRTNDETAPYVFERGRYGMACELRRRKLSFLHGLSLGQICHIVQLGITRKQLICYEDNELKPVSACLTRTRALIGEPQHSAHKDAKPCVKSVAEFIHILNELMPKITDTVLLAMLKRQVNFKFDKRICETVLHCTKLSEVMALPEVAAKFTLEKPNEKSGLLIRHRPVGDQTPPHPPSRGRLGSAGTDLETISGGTGAETNGTPQWAPQATPSMFSGLGLPREAVHPHIEAAYPGDIRYSQDLPRLRMPAPVRYIPHGDVMNESHVGAFPGYGSMPYR